MAETLFSAVYNRFLGQITDDLYLELTPEDTLKDLQNLLKELKKEVYESIFNDKSIKDFSSPQ